MKLSELKQFVDLYYRPGHEDPEVVIQIKLPYSTVGGTPTSKIKNISMGFDWDKGKFILRPEESLCPEDRDFSKKMQEMQEKLGWSDYENRGLKAEIRKLKKLVSKCCDSKYNGDDLDHTNEGNEK
jgi:hypothetical protein